MHRDVFLTAIALIAAPAAFAQPPLAVTFRGGVNLSTTATDQHGQTFTIAGLSGLTAIGSSLYAAVMDNSNKVVFISVSLGPTGAITSGVVSGGLTLADARDFEDIAWTGPQRGTLLLSEEGTPSIREYSLADGAFVGAFPSPAVFLSRRDNFGFESLSIRADSAALWTANEEALTADGPLSTPAAGTVVRLVRYDAAGGSFSAGAQHAYLTQPMHGGAIRGGRSGVSQVLALPDGRLLVLERSLALASPLFQTRIYEVDPRSAMNVSGIAALQGAAYTIVAKRLLYAGGQNNLEGLCLGPALISGGHALLGIVDDGDPISINRLVSFELTGELSGACTPDFDGDGDIGTDADIEAFFACLGGDCCVACGSADFDGDGDTGTDLDIETFFRVLGGGEC